ncbi:TPA: hypothetical protein L3N11_000925 [Vibrio parahaemolyticus]|nr:hypothetical protein [Vibrio parahaemolyticus]
MHPLQNGSQVTERPANKPVSGLPGYFTESGENNVPSYPGQDWFNDVIDEFFNGLKAAKVTFDPSSVENLGRAFSNHSKITDINSLVAKQDLEIGDKWSTGVTTWKVVDSDRGWDTATPGLYVIPLNGLFAEDIGADPNGVGDSSDAFEFAISKYNNDSKHRFTLVLASGDFNISRQIALHPLCSRFRASGGGASITATSNMDSCITWPHISDVSLKDIEFKLAPGVVIQNAIIDGGLDSGTEEKSVRTKLTNLSAFDIANSPMFIRLTQEWEFKLKNIRSDHSVANKTGTNIQFRSCVNGQVSGAEVGYSQIGIQFSKSPHVSYQCEGIDLIAPVTTYASIGLKGDNITSLKVLGGVLDFCKTRAWEFTNGSDVSFNGTWFANDSDSDDSGTLGISQPSFSNIKLTNTHFVNNKATAWDCVSLNSPNCKLYGNTSDGLLNTGLLLPDADFSGNSFIPSVRNIAITDSQIAPAGAGNAAVKQMQSGENTFASGRLLHRNEWSAPHINAAAKWTQDTKCGNFSDQVVVDWSWNEVLKYRFELATGNFRLYSGDYLFDTDATQDFAQPSKRANMIYLANSPSVTSDERCKEFFGITDAERRVALKIQTRKFKYIDSLDEKGSKARYHFGYSAQEIISAFESEGLNAFDYAMVRKVVISPDELPLDFSYDSLDDDVFRYEIVLEQVNAFILSYK